MRAVNLEVAENVKAIVDRIIARTRRNAREGLPMNTGANPEATCAELGVPLDPDRENGLIVRGFYRARK